MTVDVSLNGIKRAKWWEHAVRFLFGGLITVAAGVIAHVWGPAVGGLFLAFPSIAPASVTLVDRHEKRDAAVQDSLGASAGAVGLILFGGLVALLAPHLHAAAVLVIASAVWLGGSSFVWWIGVTVHAHIARPRARFA